MFGRDQSSQKHQNQQFSQVDEDPAVASDPSQEEIFPGSSSSSSRLIRSTQKAVAYELCLPDLTEGQRVHVRRGRLQGDRLAYPAETRADARADFTADQEEAEEEDADDADEAAADQ